MTPSAQTKMILLSRMVDSRCAMEKDVLPCMHSFSAACTTVSEAESRAEVASSKIMIAGSRTRALQIATRCFCPPDSLLPFGPTCVSNPCSPRKSILALVTHWSTQSLAALGSPYIMFSRTVVSKRMGSWPTTPI
mmetsp:Transcript_51972/g.113984  ORF Transcript_51972/g.113984 Transcript_51972/m.113984 type:complete len:135 (+) Transcript_51972:339-743(+)